MMCPRFHSRFFLERALVAQWFLVLLFASAKGNSIRPSFTNSHLRQQEPISFLGTPPYARSYVRKGQPTFANESASNNRESGRNFINEIPRLPVWNGTPLTSSDQHQIDLSQLFELMGEPRGSKGRELSELITRPKPKCNRRIRVLNGVTRIRERGSLARFQCSHGFTLIGPTTIVCLRDRWSEPPPICVRSGCRPIRRPQNAEVRQSIGGAVVAFYCSGVTQLVGDPVLFCDGIRWNGTEPKCVAETAGTTTPETESDEVWPESAATPAPFNSTVEQNSSWDDSSNIQSSLPQETTETSEMIPATNTTEAFERSSRNVVTTPSNPTTALITESHRPVHCKMSFSPATTTEIVPTGELHHDYGTSKAEQVPTEPAPVPTEQELLVQEMGPNETLSERVTPAAVEPSTQGHSLDQFTTIYEPNQVQPVTIFFQLTETESKIHEAGEQNSLLASVIPDQTSTKFPTTSTGTTTTFPPPTTPIKPNPPRRFKIRTKRPTSRRFRKPIITTAKPRWPRRTKRPPILTFTTLPQVHAFTTTDSRGLYADKKLDKSSRFSGIPSIDYPVAIDKAFLPREHVEPIRPVIFPDMLNNEEAKVHTPLIVGIVLVAVGLFIFSTGVILYWWRKNKGIARARPYDMDGRTLSAHDANDDFTWTDQRDSGGL